MHTVMDLGPRDVSVSNKAGQKQVEWKAAASDDLLVLVRTERLHNFSSVSYLRARANTRGKQVGCFQAHDGVVMMLDWLRSQSEESVFNQQEAAAGRFRRSCCWQVSCLSGGLWNLVFPGCLGHS